MTEELDAGPSDSDEREWENGWRGHEQRQLERLARLTLPEKLAWLEEAHNLVQQIRASRPDSSTSGSNRA